MTTRQISNTKREITELEGKLDDAKNRYSKLLQDQKQAFDFGGRYKPEKNKMTGEWMFPRDCTCNFSGRCLSYCNPYK